MEFRQGTLGVLSSTGEEVRVGRHPGRRRDTEEAMTSLTFAGALGARVALNGQEGGGEQGTGFRNVQTPPHLLPEIRLLPQ